MASSMRHGAPTATTRRGDQDEAANSGLNAASSTNNQPPLHTSSSSPKVTSPRISTHPPPYHANPRLKLTLPPPPKAAEVFGNLIHGQEVVEDGTRDGDAGEQGQWFWYEGKRVYVRGARRRVPSNESEDLILIDIILLYILHHSDHNSLIVHLATSTIGTHRVNVMQTYASTNPDLLIWSAPFNNRDCDDLDEYLPTPPPSSESSSSDSDRRHLPLHRL
ncbi:hypothetical protein NMY22_g874 [Coprinellus aureogranulatus]|nr:hypothetical protein NMY22_g874 [Coprinellus aureogranulatus]